MRIIGVIPARMGSSRFPGKPLAPIAGRPMVEHVYWRVAMCASLDEVYVATCDREIMTATEKFGGRAVMTSSKHERASDRVAEVAERMPADFVVMVQGDEPMIVPEMIDLGLGPLLADSTVLCTNLAAPIRSEAEFEDRNTIKVVMNAKGDALYFSREPIPTRQRVTLSRLPVYKQVCIISFRRDFLLTYTALTPTPLEQAESIDMLRAMEHGYPIRLVRCDQATQSVDTPEDLAKVDALMQGDPLIQAYGAPVKR
jgi:3-deoxy-manno-octulosonate cytidylyltransferase (CMP-KDO synthetase)